MRQDPRAMERMLGQIVEFFYLPGGRKPGGRSFGGGVFGENAALRDVLREQVRNAVERYVNSGGVYGVGMPGIMERNFGADRLGVIERYTRVLCGKIQDGYGRGARPYSIMDAMRGTLDGLARDAGEMRRKHAGIWGLYTALQQDGEALGFVFLGEQGENTCAACAAHQGRRFAAEELSVDLIPPLHPNCKCQLLPEAVLLMLGEEIVSSAPSSGLTWEAVEKGLQMSVNGMSDAVHAALDILGLVPIAGEAADLVNGVVYGLEGDTGEMLRSLIATIPLYGMIGTTGKYVDKAAGAADKVTDAAKVVDKVGDAAKVADKAVDAAKVADKATELAEHAAWVVRKYPVSPGGYFGVVGKGNNKVRNMEGGLKAAREFFEEISKGYVKLEPIGTKGERRILSDGTSIVFRSTSKDGTSVIDINYGKVFKGQKIHFNN